MQVLDVRESMGMFTTWGIWSFSSARIWKSQVRQASEHSRRKEYVWSIYTIFFSPVQILCTEFQWTCWFSILNERTTYWFLLHYILGEQPFLCKFTCIDCMLQIIQNLNVNCCGISIRPSLLLRLMGHSDALARCRFLHWWKIGNWLTCSRQMAAMWVPR